ncbi:Phospholipase D/transphosphatidylase Pld [uncultured Desulfatiglans sp.]|uniref:Phospholipase D/transphosphatidylase Pld n=1 Tax=Uncultured Desulfatiglans sp. TaxID=1748965 RepID=A0A653AA14_UNCDX|nr:Phospholipase D/transphosphatidylase Pld [uncultured Desulfatiglans sp.]
MSVEGNIVVDKQGPILKEGENCWRIENASRVSFLVDGAAYFEAFASAIDQAEKTIYIAGWEIDSRVSLFKGRKNRASVRLKEHIDKKIAATPHLQAYLLYWDFSMIYALEREWLSMFKLGWNTNRRIHFFMDDEHPTGASQHQKIVVIDDRVAFSGGIDLTGNRWDTPEHRLHDPRRINPSGRTYKPFHDIQMLVEGDAAAALGDLFRDRWHRATGKHLPCPRSEGPVPWPLPVEADMTDVRVAIARTSPAFKGRKEVREVEALYKDAIQAARRCIYIENQYLTSGVVAQALVESLEQEEGPEIVIVLPKESTGWLEKSAMDAIRARILKRLFEVDGHGRLRVLYPVLKDGETPLFVHAKIMICDERLVRIGSANLSNRSMGLDSECDLAIESVGDRRQQTKKGIAAFRNRLLAEHLGTTPEKAADCIAGHPSLIEAIESLMGSGRTLKPMEDRQDIPFDGAALVPDTSYIDPERPVQMDQMIDQFVHEEKPESRKRHLVKAVVTVLVLLGMAAAWRWTPLSEWVDVKQITTWAKSLEGSAFAGVVVAAAYVLGGILMAPVTLLVGATAMIFPPLKASVYALGGCLASAVVTYAIGAHLGKGLIRRLAGRKINRLGKILAKQGLITMVVVRNLPVAPFTVVNLIAGASRIRFRDYLIGTALGLAPGVLAISIFADRLILAVKDPEWKNISITVGLAIVLAIGIWWTKKRISKEEED